MKYVSVMIRLPQELMDELKKQSNKKGYPVKDYMLFILQKEFNGKAC